MTIKLPNNPSELLQLMAEQAALQDLNVYAVGGYVRDSLLGLPFSGEIDISVVGDGPSFAKRLASAWNIKGKIQLYRRFGTARVQAGNIRLEIATSRRESYSKQSRNPVVQPASFNEDLARRDFTINALAIDINNPDEIIDQYQGREDLKNKIIRTPLDPTQTFNDDPLRILRAVRFASRFDFQIEQQTWEAMKSQAGRLSIVARERINDEFFKIISHKKPSNGLILLYESGVLSEIFPELAHLAGVEQVGKHHHKDVLRHTFQVVDKVAEISEKLELRLAAAFHDIGKLKTKRFEEKAGWTFHGHEHVGERIVKNIGKKYKFSEELTEYISRLVRLHMRPINLHQEGVTDSAIRRLVVQAGELTDDLLILCRADITSGNKAKVKRYIANFDQMVERMKEVEQKDAFRSFQSPIRGEEIMDRLSLQEGPAVGLVKALIEEKILDGEIPYSREGAESVLKPVADYVLSKSYSQVLGELRSIMKARSQGDKPVAPGME